MLRIVLVALLVCALAACDAGGDPQAPVVVVQQFIAALEARDAEAVLARLPSDGARRQVAPELRTYLGVVERLAFREAAYELLADDGGRARVRMTAMLDYSLRGGRGGTRPVETEFELVRRDGAWYLDTIAWPPIAQEGRP